MGRTFGQNVRKIRKALGMTQETLAAKLGLKRPAQISIVESSRAFPRAQTVMRYARALACEPSALLEDVGTPYDRIRSGAPGLARPPERRSANGKRAGSR